jgi:predicted  nucleic acid-binding Zn-ribbon protein
MADYAQSLKNEDEKFRYDYKRTLHHPYNTIIHYILLFLLTISLVIIAISYNNTLNSNQTQISNLTAQLSAVNTSLLANITSVKTALTSSISTVQSDVNNLNGTVNTLSTQVSTTQTNVNTANTEITSLNKTVNNQSSQLAQLITTYNSLQSSVNTLKTEYTNQETEISNLQINLTTVNSTAINLKTNYISLSTQYSTLNTSFTGLTQPTAVPLTYPGIPPAITFNTQYPGANATLTVTQNGYLSCFELVVFDLTSNATSITVELSYVLGSGNPVIVYNGTVTTGQTNYAFADILIPITTASNNGNKFQLQVSLQGSGSDSATITSGTAIANCYLI